jgi:sodium/potassium-transporting ATPase subunit alpha
VDLVPGDIIYVRLGEKYGCLTNFRRIPADFYVFSAGDFKVDNSSLTGESEPQERVPRNTQSNPLEATNLAFNGTLCVAGEAYGVVIRTGDNTVLGQIANLTQGEAKRESPLSQEINQFVKLISVIAITTAITFFIVAVERGSESLAVRFAFALNFAIGVLVAYVSLLIF